MMVSFLNSHHMYTSLIFFPQPFCLESYTSYSLHIQWQYLLCRSPLCSLVWVSPSATLCIKSLIHLCPFPCLFYDVSVVCLNNRNWCSKWHYWKINDKSYNNHCWVTKGAAPTHASFSVMQNSKHVLAEIVECNIAPLKKQTLALPHPSFELAGQSAFYQWLCLVSL